jgi:hypothetical protein
MNRVLLLMVLCVVFAVLKTAVVALLGVAILALLFCFATRPRGTLVFLGVVGLVGLASTQPIACIVTLGVVVIASKVIGSRPKAGSQLLLTDGREHHSN